MTNIRHFRVRGEISCLFEPGSTPETVQLSGLEVELWHKSPLDIIFLGKGLTDDTGEFVIDIQVDSPVSYIEDGKIDEVFLKVYNKGQLIIGDNLYL